MKKSLQFTIITFILILFSNSTLALLPPLTHEARKEAAEVIATGKIISSEVSTEQLSDGTNAIYIVNMRVDEVEKGPQGISKGSRLIFQYWKAKKRPKGWVGNFGQNKILKVGDHVKVYLKPNDKAEMYTLLVPNGFDLK